MPKEVGSRKRIPLSKFDTYELAVAAKRDEKRYRSDQLQIRHKSDGYHLVARVTVKNTESSNGSN